MRSFLVCVVLALAIACAAAQSNVRPKLSETFESKGFVHIKHNGTLYFGEGTSCPFLARRKTSRNSNPDRVEDLS
jgi:hypothetical protein